MTMATIEPIEINARFVPNPVLVKGEGRPLVYLHGLIGQEWPDLLDRLSGRFRVHAPAHAGSTDARDLESLDGFSDLVLYYDDLFDRLGLDQFDLVGHSFGGAVAAEYAATFNRRVRKLVLIDALGLWDDDHPVADHLLAPEATRRGLLYHDPESPAALARHKLPEGQEEMLAAMIGDITALASTAHFFHPIPERGLDRRLHRITAETLVIWGEADRLAPPFYGRAFETGLQRARLAIVPDAGHSPHIEQAAQVEALISDFLA
ncbi:hypothetical protein HY78_19340 [Rhizorhabdus wittichii DC-6]|nr:hypothetical protein HY78_19340 [Rhizorhabdus wittichii DC-6]